MNAGTDELLTKALMLSKGIGFLRNLEKAFEVYRRASESGDLQATLEVGKCYECGLGVQPDQEKALQHYQETWKGGFIKGQVHVARMLLEQPDHGNAIELLHDAIAKGELSAYSLLGNALENGRGLPRDLNRAIELYRKASDRGDTESALKLARCYRAGRGVERSIQNALKLVVFGCVRSNGKAWYELGIMCMEGEIDTEDESKETVALRCFERAANLEILEAQEWCGEVYSMGTEFAEQKIEKGLYFLARARAKGSTRAKYITAVLLARGIGMPCDKSTAFALCSEAATEGDVDAQRMVKLMHMHDLDLRNDGSLKE